MIHGGRIEVIDRTLATPATHRVEALELAVPFVGNLPYLADRYVQPLLQAKINGTPFELKGELKPFADTQEYSLKLKFDGIDLPRYLGYLPKPLPVTVHNGRLDLDLDLSYRTSASVEPVLELAGRFDLTTLDLREPRRPSPACSCRCWRRAWRRRTLSTRSFTWRRCPSAIRRAGSPALPAADGTSAPAATPRRRDSKEDAGDKKSQPPLQLTIDRLRLQEGQLGIRDNLPAGGFATTLTDINLDVDGLTLAADTPFKATLDLASERREHANISGQLTLSPFSCDLDVALTGIPLPPYAPYYLGLYATALEGTVDAKTHLKISPEQPLLISAGRLEGRDLYMPFAPEEGLRMTRLVYDGIDFDLGGNRLEIADIPWRVPTCAFRVPGRGSGRFSPATSRSWPSWPNRHQSSEPEQTPFSYRIGQIALRDARLMSATICQPNRPASTSPGSG